MVVLRHFDPTKPAALTRSCFPSEAYWSLRLATTLPIAPHLHSYLFAWSDCYASVPQACLGGTTSLPLAVG